MHFLHAFDVKIKRIGEWVDDFCSVEGVGEYANRIFDGESGGIAEFAEDFIRGNEVSAVVVCGGDDRFGLGCRARSSKQELPNRVYGILVNEWIWADYGKPVDNGMRNQNSVEGITVVSG